MAWFAVLDEALGGAAAWGATPKGAVAHLAVASEWSGVPLACRPHAGSLFVASGRLLVGRVLTGRGTVDAGRDDPERGGE